MTYTLNFSMFGPAKKKKKKNAAPEEPKTSVKADPDGRPVPKLLEADADFAASFRKNREIYRQIANR